MTAASAALKDVAVHNGTPLFVHISLAAANLSRRPAKRRHWQICHRGRPLYQVQDPARALTACKGRYVRDQFWCFSQILLQRNLGFGQPV